MSPPPWSSKCQVLVVFMIYLIPCLIHDILYIYRLYQIGLHTTRSGEAAVTLVYHHTVGHSTWISEAESLQAQLSCLPGVRPGHKVSIVGRSRGKKTVIGVDHVVERLTVDGTEYQYQQQLNQFSQPNGYTCQSMLEWITQVTAGSQDQTLLELYCGNGNLTLPVSKNFMRVVATELSKPSVASAVWNLEANGLAGENGNITVAAMAAELFTTAMREKKPLPKLSLLHESDWDALQIRTLLVDPPRSGLDDDTRKLISEFERTVYISCNPVTLLRDILRAVVEDKSHRVTHWALFDQFPYTDHAECGVVLERVIAPKEL